jgi:gamma-glutamyltranspeptidase/glutathione hydrolase
VLFAPGGNEVFVEQGTWLEQMAPQLRVLGHASVMSRTLPIKSNAVEVRDGQLHGAADPRSEGQAIGE